MTQTPCITEEMVLALSKALDPRHQGVCWPDPIAWDGRPLAEQWADLVPLAKARLEDISDQESEEAERIRRALAILEA